MNRLVLAVALAALTACGAPPPNPAYGPVLPNGAHALTLKQLGVIGPNDLGPDVIASTSLAQVRDAVITHARYSQVCSTGAGPADRCWQNVPDSPGYVYVAVITNIECNRPVEETTGIGGNTLYFIHWVGQPRGVCDLMMALATWRLYSVSRSMLPSSGKLTVRLEMQGNATGAVESQVQLT